MIKPRTSTFVLFHCHMVTTVWTIESDPNLAQCTEGPNKIACNSVQALFGCAQSSVHAHPDSLYLGTLPICSVPKFYTSMRAQFAHRLVLQHSEPGKILGHFIWARRYSIPGVGQEHHRNPTLLHYFLLH